MKKINVLGTKYTLEERNPQSEPALERRTGFCDTTSKEIVIASAYQASVNSVKAPDIVKMETIRHELVHAFFSESGMEGWSSDEALVDWVAIQFPKMQQAMREAGGL